MFVSFFRIGALEDELKTSTKSLEEQFKNEKDSLITRSVSFQTDIEQVMQCVVECYIIVTTLLVEYCYFMQA